MIVGTTWFAPLQYLECWLLDFPWLFDCAFMPPTNEDCLDLRFHGLKQFSPLLFRACVSWPCVTQHVCMLEMPALLPFNFFAWCFGMVVGEAAHPWPEGAFPPKPLKLVVSNPTAVHKKVMSFAPWELT